MRLLFRYLSATRYFSPYTTADDYNVHSLKTITDETNLKMVSTLSDVIFITK